MVEEDCEPRLLYMCLGDPGGTAVQSDGAAGIQTEVPSRVDVYDSHFLFDDGDAAFDFSSDEEQWEYENL